MKRNPIQTYALTVCFASLFAGSISLAVGIYDIIQISFPESTNVSYRAQLESVQEQQFLRDRRLQAYSVRPAETPSSNTTNLSIAPSEITWPKADYYVSKALQSLIFSGIVLFICMGVFYFHWNLAKPSDTDNE